jgi:adenosylhomocysteine nucleosidase
VPDITITDPCVLFAVRREALSFRREFRPHTRFRSAPCRAWFCGPPWLTVLVAETGVGAAAAERALTWLLNRPLYGNVPYRPKLVLSAGFSGALRPGLRVGDLVLATEVADAAGNVWKTTWPGDLPAGDWRPPLQRGRLLTTPDLVGNPEQKRLLGARHDALAVDMETAAVARLCGLHEVPFGCLRAFSDECSTPLSPQLVDVLSAGRVSPWRVLRAAAVRPRLLAEFWRLAADTRTAARQLGRGLGEVLTLTLPWMAEEGEGPSGEQRGLSPSSDPPA